MIAGSSMISTGPIIEESEFPWTQILRDHWRSIRMESEALLPDMSQIPALRLVSPDHRRIAQDDLWKSFFLYGYGYKVPENCARCPVTTAVVEQIPDLNSAFFSILLPGTRIAPHRGPTKGIVTCHLGLFVPSGDGCCMRLADQLVHWQEGECLVFDDTYRHEVWHEEKTPRVVLLLQVKRPLRFPGRQVADLFLTGIRLSPFVQEGRRNLAAWQRAARTADRPD